jgi:hypothetical protein
MQKGSLIRSSRRQGPDVWEYRWRESCSGQTRKHRRIVIGSLNIPKDESAALNSNDSGDRSQRRSNVANQLFPRAGRANRPILEHRAYAGGTFQQFRHAGAAALVGWPVRCDVFRRDPAHARDRYSIGAGGDTSFYHLAGAGDDRRRNSDCATLRLGVRPLVESQLYDVKQTDPVTILAATLVLCSTALGAALIPARRASAVNLLKHFDSSS